MTASGLFLSVVVPVCNEADNVASLAREVQSTMASHGTFELIFVDDGSTDGTAAAILASKRTIAEIRLIQHSHRAGQSAALCTGIRAARGEWVVTLDGDGQNDPADIPKLLAVMQRAAQDELALVIGHRQTRKDSWVRRISSRVANGIRRRLLHDDTPDTGCGIKLLHRDSFLQLPVFDHMHRFLPALFQRVGARVISVPVHHRPRMHGTSKYGIHNRLWVGIGDLLGVQWLIRRALPAVNRTEE